MILTENVIHTELEIKLSQSFPTIPNFCSHFHSYVWRQLTNLLFFFRAKTPHLPCDGWDCCQGRKSIGQPMNKTDNFIFWMTFSKIVVKSHITASPGREGQPANSRSKTLIGPSVPFEILNVGTSIHGTKIISEHKNQNIIVKC